MRRILRQTPSDSDETERREWLDSLDYVILHRGAQQVNSLLSELHNYAQQAGIQVPFTANTPYINTIPADRQNIFPGSRELERKIRTLVRSNALAMVVRANREESGIGGDISTYASAASYTRLDSVTSSGPKPKILKGTSL